MHLRLGITGGNVTREIRVWSRFQVREHFGSGVSERIQRQLLSEVLWLSGGISATRPLSH